MVFPGGNQTPNPARSSECYFFHLNYSAHSRERQQADPRQPSARPLAGCPLRIRSPAFRRNPHRTAPHLTLPANQRNQRTGAFPSAPSAQRLIYFWTLVGSPLADARSACEQAAYHKPRNRRYWLLAHTPKPPSLATPLPRPQPLARTAPLRRRQSRLFVALAHERWVNSADCKNCTEPYDSARRSRRSRPTPAVTAYSFFTLKLRNSTGSLCPAKPMWPFVWSSPFGGVLI